MGGSAVHAQKGAGRQGEADLGCDSPVTRSLYIPVDSWIYPAVLRLYALGYMDNVYAGVRPWTWDSLSNMLEDTEANLEDEEASEIPARAGRELFQAIERELKRRAESGCNRSGVGTQIESAYSVARGINGTPLRDSFHLGSTIVNDYGRPFASGLSSYTGASGWAAAGRFTLYVRGEFEGAPSATGYSSVLAQTLAAVDGTVNPVTGVLYPGQATLPQGQIGAATQGRLLEAYVSTQALNHVISFGKSRVDHAEKRPVTSRISSRARKQDEFSNSISDFT